MATKLVEMAATAPYPLEGQDTDYKWPDDTYISVGELKAFTGWSDQWIGRLCMTGQLWARKPVGVRRPEWHIRVNSLFHLFKTRYACDRGVVAAEIDEYLRIREFGIKGMERERRIQEGQIA